MSPKVFFCFATDSGVGGVQEWMDRQCRHLSEHGFDPVVGLVRGLKTHQPERLKDHFHETPTVEIDGRGLNREGRIRAIQRMLAKVQPDIVIPAGIVDTHDAVCRAKLAGSNLRLVAQVQGNNPQFLADIIRYREFVDHVVCPGALAARFAKQVAQFQSNRVSHIPNGAASPLVPRRTHTVPPLRIAYVGRLTNGDKRVLDLNRVIPELHRRGVDFTLDIVGDGPCSTSLQEVLGSGPLAQRVRFHGRLSNTEVYRTIYPQVDVLLLLSSSEAFGIVLAEAMINGVVPVASRYLGHATERLVQDQHNGLLFPIGNAGAAVDALERLANSSSLLSTLAQNATATGQQYTWDVCLSRWTDALGTVLNQPLVRGSELPSTPIPRNGRLDHWGVPPAITDGLRRLKRSLVGCHAFAGGEEWPLFGTDYPSHLLDEISATLLRLDTGEDGVPAENTLSALDLEAASMLMQPLPEPQHH